MLLKKQSVTKDFGIARRTISVAGMLLALSACNLGITGPSSVFNEVGSAGTIDRVGNTGSTSNYIPLAVADRVITDSVNPITIDILANDYGLGDLPLKIEVSSLPDFGNITIEENNSVTFTPNSNFTGIDSFAYVVTDASGDTSTAIASLDIRCTECQSDGLVTLQWNPNPQNITGYIVDFGPTANEVTQLASVMYNNSGDYNPQSPFVQLDVVNDLGLEPGENVCFTIKAFNAGGVSAPSEAICSTV